MQRSLFLLMVACLALASCKDVNRGTDGVDAGGGKGGSSGSAGGTTSAGGAGGSASTPGTGGSMGSGGTTGATGGATSSSPDCAAVGCSPPPLCSEGCTAPCGCCPCATGTRNGDLICTKSGCYDWAAAPDAAGLDQAVDVPQTDAARGGAGGSGGTIGTGGFTGTGGTTASSPVDAGANSCNNPLPLQCGDRLNHSTLIQGRASVWSGYACSQRAESGRETIYALQTTAACQVAVQLKNLTVDLDLFVLTGCAPGPYDKCSSTPLDLQTIETVNFTSQAGQPYFVVVDGYNYAAGTYTLEVDCTCNQDAGTIDAPRTDAPRGGAGGSGGTTGTGGSGGTCGDPAILARYAECSQANDQSSCEAAGGTWSIIGKGLSEECQCPTGQEACKCTLGPGPGETPVGPCLSACVSEYVTASCSGVVEGHCSGSEITVGCWCMFFSDGTVQSICID